MKVKIANTKINHSLNTHLAQYLLKIN